MHGSARWALGRSGNLEESDAVPSLVLTAQTPHKYNPDRRHHIQKMSFKVQNCPAYETDLRRRGSLTLWIEDAALGCWQTTAVAGQARSTNAAIQTSRTRATEVALAVHVLNRILALGRPIFVRIK